jgi:hypothetical protein
MNAKQIKDYVSVPMIASVWGVSSQRVRSLCIAGRIKGAFKTSDERNGQWMIPIRCEDPRKAWGAPRKSE